MKYDNQTIKAGLLGLTKYFILRGILEVLKQKLMEDYIEHALDNF